MEVEAGGETAKVSSGEMAELTVTEAGETVLSVVPFAEEYIAPFVLAELERDTDLAEAILNASGLDALDPPDPAERLQAAYNEILSGKPLFDGFNPGLCYADYIDADGNGTLELLLMNLSPLKTDGESEGWDYSLELYGENLGYVKQYDLDAQLQLAHFSDPSPRTLSLVQSGNQMYLHEDIADGSVRTHTYYLIESDSVSVADQIYADSVSAYEEYYWDELNGTELTAEQFEAIYHKYTEVVEILADTSSLSPTRNRGILPEIPVDF